jgi:Pvc16 N-terminal domain
MQLLARAVIDRALLFLKSQLNDHLSLPALGQPPVASEDNVVFLDGDKSDPVSFKLGAVTALLINVEQESILRPANPYLRIGADGSAYQTRPDIRLNLCVLFVARFKQYEQSLGQLSRVISYFQAHPVLDPQTAPMLPAGIGRLTMELMTLPLAEQNDLWNALRTAYQPSVLYRVRMLVFEDQQATPIGPVSTTTTDLVHASRAAS